MITFLIIYLVVYLICTYLAWGVVIGEKNTYPDYKNEPVTFWDYIIVFNPLNVFIGIGFILWGIYDGIDENKKMKKRKDRKLYDERDMTHDHILDGIESLHYRMEHLDDVKNKRQVSFLVWESKYVLTDDGIRLLELSGCKKYVDSIKDELLELRYIKSVSLRLFNDSKKSENFKDINEYFLNNRMYEGTSYNIFTLIDLMICYFENTYGNEKK